RGAVSTEGTGRGNGSTMIVEGADVGPGEAEALAELAEGSSPASLASGPGDGSMTTEMSKKWMACGQVDGTLRSCLGAGTELMAHRVRHAPTATMPRWAQ